MSATAVQYSYFLKEAWKLALTSQPRRPPQMITLIHLPHYAHHTRDYMALLYVYVPSIL